jgi:hypothetical protein
MIGSCPGHRRTNSYKYLKGREKFIEGELEWVSMLRSKGNVLCEFHVKIEKRSLNVTLLTVTPPLFIICLVYVEANSFSGFVTYHSSLMVFVEVVEIGEGVQGELCVLSMVSLSLALRGG